MNGSNQELLSKFYEEQKALINKLKAIRNAIVGFGGEISNEELQGLLELEEDVQPPKPLVVPQEFSKNLPQIQKIAFVIKTLGGEAYVSEIADKIIDLEGFSTLPDGEKAIVRRNITLLTSYLYRDNRLTAKKNGNKYRYRLNEGH